MSSTSKFCSIINTGVILHLQFYGSSSQANLRQFLDKNPVLKLCHIHLFGFYTTGKIQIRVFVRTSLITFDST